MFRRRTTRTLIQLLREILWPSMGWSRALKYAWHRLKRLTASPHAIALGAAFGIFASFTPFMGLHILLAIALSYLFGGNILAAAFGTVTGNPVTFPLIWVAGYNVGVFLFGDFAMPAEVPPQPAIADLVTGQFDQLKPLVLTMTAGGLPLGLISAVICYFPIRMTIEGFQSARRQRITRRARIAGRGISLYN